MDDENALRIDLNISAELARAANLIVNQGEASDLSSTAAHLCGALGLVLFSMSKPGETLECIPGLMKAMRDILLQIESIDGDDLSMH